MNTNKAGIISKYNEYPVIKTSNLNLALFTVIFIALDVLLPFIFHQFGISGQIFLPMHFLILIAALLFGWRIGLMVGLFTPIISYFISGMPLLPILPLVTIEVASYGLFAGFLREKFKLNLILSLILSMISGRLLLGLAVVILGMPDPIDHVLNVVKTGLPGTLIQLALVPLIVKFLYGRIKKQKAY